MEQILKPLTYFAKHHDELPAFHAAYLALTIIAAAMLNLGFFAVLVLIHMALDVYKYKVVHHGTWAEVAEGVVRESLLDITLLLLGMVFAVYLYNVTLGGGTTELSIKMNILRAMLLFIPKLTILHHFLKVVSHVHHYIQNMHVHIHKPWRPVEITCMVICLIALFLLAFAPSLLQLDRDIIIHIVANILNPLKI